MSFFGNLLKYETISGASPDPASSSVHLIDV